jgi:hypothetical protein
MPVKTGIQYYLFLDTGQAHAGMTRLFVMPVKTGIQYLFIPGYRPGPCQTL